MKANSFKSQTMDYINNKKNHIFPLIKRITIIAVVAGNTTMIAYTEYTNANGESIEI